MPEIRIEKLSYRYPPFHHDQEQAEVSYALRDLNLMIPIGEMVGIIGTTGGGKTSLCLAITGLIPQQTGGSISGDVWVGEWNTKRVPVVEMATRVGIVFQDPEANFLGLTVEDEIAFGLENLALPVAEMEPRIARALGQVGMDALRQRPISTLSGGQKQRIAIAAVLAMQPEILVLDDPTAELDPVGRRDVLGAIADIRQSAPETTIVLASSDPASVAESVDRVLVLVDGQVRASGTPDEVFAGEVDLRGIGVSSPEVADLALGCNREFSTSFHFSRYAEARRGLEELLAPTSPE